MKKTIKFILLVICFIFSSANISAHDFKYWEEYKYWEELMNAISYVESNHNPKARNGIYVGCLQIGPGMVNEVNNILKKENNPKRYTLNDRYDPQKSREMFVIFQIKYNPNGNIERAIRMWNGGPRYSVSKTNRYYNAVIYAYNNPKS